MGVSGLAFGILRFALSVMAESSDMILDPSSHGYFRWIALKFFIRVMGILIQLLTFYRLPPSVGHHNSIRNEKMTHFLVPCIMLCQLAVFIDSIIDSYSYLLDRFVNEVHLNVPAAAVYRIGEPLHLGFYLHMFFHFLNFNIMLNMQGEP